MLFLQKINLSYILHIYLFVSGGISYPVGSWTIIRQNGNLTQFLEVNSKIFETTIYIVVALFFSRNTYIQGIKKIGDLPSKHSIWITNTPWCQNKSVYLWVYCVYSINLYAKSILLVVKPVFSSRNGFPEIPKLQMCSAHSIQLMHVITMLDNRDPYVMVYHNPHV